MLHDEKGVALPLVLIIMLVLGLLGAALMQYNVADSKQVANEIYKSEAHYAARAGADAMADFLIKNPTAISEVAAKTVLNPATGSIGSVPFLVSVSDHDDYVEITTDATANSVSQNIKLILEKDTSINLFTNAIAQTSKNKEPLELGALQIENESTTSVESTGIITGFSGIKHENSTNIYPPPDFPKDSELTFKTYSDNIVEPDSLYSNISQNNGKVTFLTGGKTVKVKVNTLYIKADLVIDGGGRVELYVENKATFQTPKDFGNSPNQLIIYLKKEAELEIQANGTFNGFIYAPEAKIEIQSNKTHIHGAIVGETIRRNNVNGPHGILTHHSLTSDIYIPSVLAFKRSHWSK